MGCEEHDDIRSKLAGQRGMFVHFRPRRPGEEDPHIEVVEPTPDTVL